MLHHPTPSTPGPVTVPTETPTETRWNSPRQEMGNIEKDRLCQQLKKDVRGTGHVAKRGRTARARKLRASRSRWATQGLTPRELTELGECNRPWGGCLDSKLTSQRVRRDGPNWMPFGIADVQLVSHDVSIHDSFFRSHTWSA